jgi:hypothetical protein
MIGGGIGNTLVGKGHTKAVILAGYIISIGGLIPRRFVGPKYGIWYVIFLSMLYLFPAPGIAVVAQAIVLNDIPLEDHGTAAALMNVMYQFGSSLFVAIANVVMNSNKGDNEDAAKDPLQQYRNGI